MRRSNASPTSCRGDRRRAFAFDHGDPRSVRRLVRSSICSGNCSTVAASLALNWPLRRASSGSAGGSFRILGRCFAADRDRGRLPSSRSCSTTRRVRIGGSSKRSIGDCSRPRGASILRAATPRPGRGRSSRRCDAAGWQRWWPMDAASACRSRDGCISRPRVSRRPASRRC